MITNVTPGTASSASGQSQMKQATGMDKDDFLKLFVTQLQNQDPLNPQDGTQFISQLAQLTQVEQAYNTNSNLQNILNQGSNATTLAALSLIGKQVEAPGSQVDLKSGSASTISYQLDKGADQVTVSVKDANGTVVRTLSAGAQGAGNASVTWDGTDNSGHALASGAYSFSVSAKDASGNSVASTGIIKGKVDGVDMSGTTPVLSLGSVKVNLTDVTAASGGA